MFIVAQRDEIVPTEIQQRIVDAYAGPKKDIEMPDATQAAGRDVHQNRYRHSHADSPFPTLDSVQQS